MTRGPNVPTRARGVPADRVPPTHAALTLATEDCPNGGGRTPPMNPKGGIMDRKSWDRLVSWSGLIVAIALIVVGALAVYGGRFGQNNVTDRLAPEKVTFPAYDAMTDEEKATVGDFAGQQVLNGQQAEAFASYIAGHLAFVNDGKTYAETSAAARAEGIPADQAAELQAKADTLFKGETLRSIMLNAYGWWTVSTIAIYAGWVMVAAGVVLLVLAILGFRHMRQTPEVTVRAPADDKVMSSV
jgi:hypothetical protein